MSHLEPATILNDRYQLREELGRGGMGEVYRAHDKVLDRQVAVKLLGDSGLGTEGRQRMLREAQAIAKLNHPNIVQVFDAGELEGSPYIVMELVEGDSLDQRPPKDLAATVEIARQICAALEHAHQHDIVHRDLKPENVVIADDGSAKLMDFGLARSLASRMTVEGEISGTVFYLAPELALGKDYDGRADLYSLGVMLYELAAGELPFTQGDPLTIISQHIHADVVPLRNKQAEVPPLFEQLVMQLLSKDPDDRPESAAAFEQLLAQPALLDPQAETDRELSLIGRIVRGKFVGRAAELKQAKSLWSQAVGEQGQALLVSGEPGIGKTRFLRELATHVEVSGGLALVGEAYESAGAPYAPFAQMLRRGLQHIEQAGIEVPEPILADLLDLAPELRPYHPDVPANPPLNPEAEQQRQFESVVGLLSTLSERTALLIGLDDAHWADSGSLALLRHLARRTRSQPVMLVATYREIELDEASPLHEALLDLERNRLGTRLKLGRFTIEETHDLLHAIFEEEITPEFLNRIHQETDGNPFFIEEVCKALVESGKLYFEDGRWHRPSIEQLEVPQSVRMAIQSRVVNLPDDAQDMLRLAAIVGREFEYEVLAAASDLDEDPLIDALEAAQQAQLIEEVSGSNGITFSFVHALVPSTLVEGVRTLRRRRLHRRIADAIVQAKPGAFEAIAYHYEEAGDEARSLEYYRKAADRAVQAYANPEAERHLLTLLDLIEDEGERSQLLGELAQVQSRQGKFELAIEHWLQGVGLARSLGEDELSAHYYARAARAAWEAGEPPRGLELGLVGLQQLDGAADSAGLAELLHETGRAYYFNGMPDEARPILKRGLKMAEATDAVGVRVESLISLATAGGLTGGQSAEENVRLLGQAIELARAHNLPDEESRALNNLTVIKTHQVGDLSGSRERTARAMELAESTGSTGIWLFYGATACFYALSQGDLPWVRDQIPKLHDARLRMPTAVTSGLTLLSVEGNLLLRSGEVDQAMELFRQLHREAVEGGEFNAVYSTAIYFAEAAIESGKELDEALSMLEAVWEGHLYGGPIWPLSMVARVLTAQGKLTEAAAVLENARDEDGKAQWGLSPVWLGFVEAELAEAKEEWAEAERAYQATATAAEKSGLHWHHAYIHWRWAEVLLSGSGGREIDRTIELLRRARDEFEACGAPMYVKKLQSRIEELNAS